MIQGKMENSKEKKTKIANNKKIILFLLCILVIAIVLCLTLINRNSNNNPAYKPIPEITQVLNNATVAEQENIQISNIQIESLGATITTKAKLKNMDNMIKEAQITLYLYDETNLMRGKNSITIENLDENSEIEISNSLIGGYTDLSKYELKVENVKRTN